MGRRLHHESDPRRAQRRRWGGGGKLLQQLLASGPPEAILTEARRFAQYLASGKSVKLSGLTVDERRLILPAWADYVIVRDMGGMTWQDVQDLPADVHAFWLAFRAGESDARRERAHKERNRVVQV